jgi:predicted nuclease of predicted toxin-antitoxin system
VTLRFYSDTHVAKAIAEQLRAHSVDVIRCEEIDMAEAADERHLEYAARERRVMVTQDADFAALHRRWLQAGRSHAGIMRIPADLQGEAQIRFVVRELLFYHEAERIGALSLAADIENQLIYL